MREEIEKRGKALIKKIIRKSRRVSAQLKTRLKSEPRVPASAFDVDVSVVIPVYNCDEYIEQAVRSISDQTTCRYEIIAINDQSPDDALGVLQGLAAEIPQLTVLDQSNIGGARTLNRGLAMARGKYVTFLDCDDWLAPNALDALFDAAETTGAELVGGIIQKFTEGVFDDIHDFSYIKKRMDINVAAGIPDDVFVDSFYTGKLFLRSHLRKFDIEFNPTLLYADRPFVTKAMVAADKLVFLPKILGYWRKHIDGRSVTDGFQNPRNIVDKMSGFGALLRDPVVTANEAFHKRIFLEATKRLFWNYDDVKDPQFAEAFAYAAGALVAGFPGYAALSSSEVSLRQKLIFDQVSSYDAKYLHSYSIALEQVIAASSGQTVTQIASQMRSVPHVGQRLASQPPYPVLKDRNMVVFESFFGKSYGGNPRYLYEELVRSGRRFTAVWVYSPKRRPFRMTAPDHVNLVQVSRGSPEYYQFLREARYWVNNIRFPEIEKPEGTIYIQTWHGTPLKRLGLDIEMSGPEADGRASFLEDAEQWDYLLAQNEYSADIFRRAFNVQCPILVEGYPGNDVLASPLKRRLASAQIRRKYRIPSSKKIITYAPTWRDKDQIGDTWAFANKIMLDFKAMRAALGDEYVVILRLHHLMAKAVSFSGLEGFLYDGSKEPDANRLMAATDILVTDYSSIFFDFACTGRPMLFYMYDLDEYESELRGFYIDPRKELPGPILRDQDALFAAVRDIEKHKADYADQYRKFHDKFISLDKGTSSRAVVERVFSRERNTEDLKDLLALRAGKRRSAEIARLVAESQWDTAVYDYDVSLVVESAVPPDLDRLLHHDDVRVQLIWITETADAAATVPHLSVVSSSPDTSRHERLRAALAAATGKYVMVTDPAARFRPDTLRLLVNRAEDSTANLVIAGTAPAFKRQGLNEFDLVRGGFAETCSLTDMLVLARSLRRYLPSFEAGAAYDKILALLLIGHARRCVVSQAFPSLPARTFRLRDMSVNDVINALHFLGNASPALSRDLRAFGLGLADHVADPRERTAHVDALHAAVGNLVSAEVQDGSLAMKQPAPVLSEVEPGATVTAPAGLADGLAPVKGTYFISLSGRGMSEHASRVLNYLARTQPDARIAIDGVFTMPTALAPGVEIRQVSYGTAEYWYWACRAQWLFAEGLLPTALSEILRGDHHARQVMQIGICADMQATGWTDGIMIGERVLGRSFDDIPDCALWTHVCVLASGNTDQTMASVFQDKTVLRIGGVTWDSVDAARRNLAFRDRFRIQRNKTLIGVMRLRNAAGAFEDMLDIDYLRTRLPPKSEFFLSSEADNLRDFFAACDVLVSPPHPAIGAYLVSGKPFVPQHSYLLDSKGEWAERADAYQTHDAIAEAINAYIGGRGYEPLKDAGKVSDVAVGSSIQRMLAEIIPARDAKA